MPHISFESIADYVDEKLTPDRKRAVDSHLLACGACEDVKQELQTLKLQLRADPAFEPPPDLMAWGINLFQPMIQPAEPGILKRIIAALVFDTDDEPALAGVRRLGVSPRQLLFRAGDLDVDVKIESIEISNRMNLIGQVLPKIGKFFADASVSLESHGSTQYRTTTNVVGEFSFDEIPKEDYHLHVDLPEGRITLLCVNRGSA